MQSITEQLEEVGFEVENFYTDEHTGSKIRELSKLASDKQTKLMVVTQDHMFMGFYLISDKPICLSCDKLKDIKMISNLITL